MKALFRWKKCSLFQMSPVHSHSEQLHSCIEVAEYNHSLICRPLSNWRLRALLKSITAPFPFNFSPFLMHFSTHTYLQNATPTPDPPPPQSEASLQCESPAP